MNFDLEILEHIVHACTTCFSSVLVLVKLYRHVMLFLVGIISMVLKSTDLNFYNQTF